MKVSEFAREIRVSEAAVRKAARNGRLSRSVTRDEQGRIVTIDAKLGAAEWERNRTRLAPLHSARRREPMPELPAATVEAVVEGLVGVLRDVQTDERATFAGYAPEVIKGCAEGLWSAGREPTRDALEAALLAEGADGPGAWVVWAVQEATRDMDTDRNGTNAVAREQGARAARQLVTGTFQWGASDGDE